MGFEDETVLSRIREVRESLVKYGMQEEGIMNFVWEQIQVVNGQPSEPIMIIARNFRYAHEWCRIHDINFKSPRVRIVSRLEDLLGFSGVYYVDLGIDNADLRSLIEGLKATGTIKPLMTPNI